MISTPYCTLHTALNHMITVLEHFQYSRDWLQCALCSWELDRNGETSVTAILWSVQPPLPFQSLIDLIIASLLACPMYNVCSGCFQQIWAVVLPWQPVTPHLLSCTQGMSAPLPLLLYSECYGGFRGVWFIVLPWQPITPPFAQLYTSKGHPLLLIREGRMCYF